MGRTDRRQIRDPTRNTGTVSRPYTGNKDLADGPRPGTVQFLNWLCFFFGGVSRGVYARRTVRGGTATSVHQTGRAFDYGGSTEQIRQAIDFCYKTRELFEIEAIHDYLGLWIPTKGFGAAYRCSRDSGGLYSGWKVYDRPTLGGGGRWTHVELAPSTANSAELIDQKMRELFAALENE